MISRVQIRNELVKSRLNFSKLLFQPNEYLQSMDFSTHRTEQQHHFGTSILVSSSSFDLPSISCYCVITSNHATVQDHVKLKVKTDHTIVLPKQIQTLKYVMKDGFLDHFVQNEIHVYENEKLKSFKSNLNIRRKEIFEFGKLKK